MVTCEDLGYDTCTHCGNGIGGYTGCVPRGTDQRCTSVSCNLVYPSFYINNSTGKVGQVYDLGHGLEITDVTKQNVNTLPFKSYPTSINENLVNDMPVSRITTTPSAPLLQNLLNQIATLPPTPVQTPPPQARQDTGSITIPNRITESPPTPVQTPPPQARQDTGSITIPNRITESPPTMARDTTTSSPSIFSSAKPVIIIGVALFAAASLFLTPKASKRR